MRDGPLCQVCSSPHRVDFEAAVIAGEPIVRVAARLSVQRDAAYRHARHMVKHDPKARQDSERRDAQRRPNLLVNEASVIHAQVAIEHTERVIDKVQRLERDARAICDEAMQEGGDRRLALDAIARLTKIVELYARMFGELQPDRPGSELTLSQAAAIFAALAPYPEARAAVALALRASMPGNVAALSAAPN